MIHGVYERVNFPIENRAERIGCSRFLEMKRSLVNLYFMEMYHAFIVVKSVVQFWWIGCHLYALQTLNGGYHSNHSELFPWLNYSVCLFVCFDVKPNFNGFDLREI